MDCNWTRAHDSPLDLPLGSHENCIKQKLNCCRLAIRKWNKWCVHPMIRHNFILIYYKYFKLSYTFTSKSWHLMQEYLAKKSQTIKVKAEKLVISYRFETFVVPPFGLWENASLCKCPIQTSHRGGVKRIQTVVEWSKQNG